MARNPKRLRKPLPEQRWIKAVSHPLRIAILEMLAGEIRSPNELTKALDRRLGDTSYHVRALVKAECIELVDTQAVRGATEHFYCAKPRSSFTHQLWRNLPHSLRGHHTAGVLEGLLRRAVASIEAGLMDEDDETVLSLIPVPVDRQGRLETTEVLLAAQDEIERISSDSLHRLEQCEEKVVQLVVGLASFRAVPLYG